MINPMQFNEILEAATDLPIEDQEYLIDILNRRIQDIRRAEIVRDAESAQQEYAKKHCKPVTPEELMKELLG